MNEIEKIKSLWSAIYKDQHLRLRDSFIQELGAYKSEHAIAPLPAQWYKDVTVYSLYVDLFNENFQGLEAKLDYLENLGVSCLWLLPILDSPMRDAGFDIRNYRRIRPELLDHKSRDEVFGSFLEKAHRKGIKVIFDIAINHTSDEHPWFKEASSSSDNPYRDYYIWSTDPTKYSEARIIFYGIEESNWKKHGDEYYFHRFFDFQPDLNYRNPQVLIEMCRNFMFWLSRGVDGFRADAIPYLWKEEGTSCENLPTTHLLVKFFRAVIEYIRPNTLLLAEACQKPIEVVKYFGNGDECHAGYHFPLMPQIFKSLAMHSTRPIVDILRPEVSPDIPHDSQWFTFLRCHDELSLELVYVSENDRRYIHENYCKQPEWDFRKGQGISARLADLMAYREDRISLIYSIMLTLPGTPVIYYGDEFGKTNDRQYYREQIKLSGKDDTRFLVRGRINWQELEQKLKDPDSREQKVYSSLSKMLQVRKEHAAFGRGDIQWLDLGDKLLAFVRRYGHEVLLIIHNLGEESVQLGLPSEMEGRYRNLLSHQTIDSTSLQNLAPNNFLWLSKL